MIRHVHIQSKVGATVGERTRTYEERLSNGVMMVTTIVDGPDAEIRYAVTRDGKILFNQALTGKYSPIEARQLAKAQEAYAMAAVEGR